MVLMGVLVNVAAILGGCLVGSFVRLSGKIRDTIMQGLGLAVCIIGITTGLESSNIMIPIAALVVGGGIGAALDLETRLERTGQTLSKILARDDGGFNEGFLTATLVYCIGAMAVIGSLNSGLYGDHHVLYAKSMLDGISAIFFTASFGIGVAFSAVPLFLYQGSIVLLAGVVAPLLSEGAIGELSATGGMLIMGIGLNMVNATKIKVGNLLPAIPIALIIGLFFA